MRAAVLILLLLAGCAESVEEPLRIGAILPLSGPAATWGESIRDGMEMAREDLAAQGMPVEIIYEDSQLTAQGGVAAYNKLVNVDDVDIIVSAISRVSVPLVPLAEDDGVPLLMTGVSAANVTDGKYVFRFFSTAQQYALPQVEEVAGAGHDRVALLVMNDELGVSIADIARAALRDRGIMIVAEERFDPGTSDFRTQLAKIDAQGPDAILTTTEPSGAVALLRQRAEMGIDAEFYDMTTTLLSRQAIMDAGMAAEGVHIAVFPFAVGDSGVEFHGRYTAETGRDPFFMAAFGYDAMMLLAQATGGKSADADTLVEGLRSLGTVDTLNGEVTVLESGEINTPTRSATIRGGEIVSS